MPPWTRPRQEAEVADASLSQPFWAQAPSALLPARRPMFHRLRTAALTGQVHGPAPEHETYEVVSGDTLTRIADRFLGDTRRWDEVHDLNRAIIGADPDAIEVGMHLRLPPP